MTEPPKTPPPPGPPGETPPPPGETPPRPGEGAAPPPGEAPPPPPPGKGEPNALMIVLAYLWILALVPLLVEKEDREVQWHAKHGIVLLAAEIVFWVAVSILTTIPGLNLLGCLLGPVVWVAFLVIHVLCIVKGLRGERFVIPFLSQYADRF